MTLTVARNAVTFAFTQFAYYRQDITLSSFSSDANKKRKYPSLLLTPSICTTNVNLLIGWSLCLGPLNRGESQMSGITAWKVEIPNKVGHPFLYDYTIWKREGEKYRKRTTIYEFFVASCPNILLFFSFSSCVFLLFLFSSSVLLSLFLFSSPIAQVTKKKNRFFFPF